MLYEVITNHDQAFEWLERAFEDRDRMMTNLLVHPRLDPLRGDARFADLIARMKLGR